MALKLYEPKAQAFTTYTPPVGALPFDQLMLLNILIELKSINQYLSAQNAGTLFESPENVLSDIVIN